MFGLVHVFIVGMVTGTIYIFLQFGHSVRCEVTMDAIKFFFARG
jgi:hypothetical protein